MHKPLPILLVTIVTLSLLSISCKNRNFNKNDTAKSNSIFATDNENWKDLFYVAQAKMKDESEFQCWYVASMGMKFRNFEGDFKNDAMKNLQNDVQKLQKDSRFAPIPNGKKSVFIKTELIAKELEKIISITAEDTKLAHAETERLRANAINVVKHINRGNTSQIRRTILIGAQLVKNATDHEIAMEQDSWGATTAREEIDHTETATQLSAMQRTRPSTLSMLHWALERLHKKAMAGKLEESDMGGSCPETFNEKSEGDLSGTPTE